MAVVRPLSVVLLLVAGGGGLPADLPPPPPGRYRPPVAVAVVDPFRPPPVPWASGNRGLEYGTRGGEPVVAVAAGVVTVARAVAGRLVVTVRHPDGRRSSLSGLAVVLVRAGQPVGAGELVGIAAAGLHLGVRVGNRYVDPAALFGGPPRRARLVPVRAAGDRPVTVPVRPISSGVRASL